eukprot:5146805-Alexandrium_andersonii.AAC.1
MAVSSGPLFATCAHNSDGHAPPGSRPRSRQPPSQSQTANAIGRTRIARSNEQDRAIQPSRIAPGHPRSGDADLHHAVKPKVLGSVWLKRGSTSFELSLIHISEPTRLALI